jgi:hypothetical protein
MTKSIHPCFLVIYFLLFIFLASDLHGLGPFCGKNEGWKISYVCFRRKWGMGWS